MDRALEVTRGCSEGTFTRESLALWRTTGGGINTGTAYLHGEMLGRAGT